MLKEVVIDNLIIDPSTIKYIRKFTIHGKPPARTFVTRRYLNLFGKSIPIWKTIIIYKGTEESKLLGSSIEITLKDGTSLITEHQPAKHANNIYKQLVEAFSKKKPSNKAKPASTKRKRNIPKK